jgi:hypothetical protein
MTNECFTSFSTTFQQSRGGHLFNGGNQSTTEKNVHRERVELATLVVIGTV